MPDGESQTSRLHERTLDGLRQVIERALGYVHGVERLVISRAIQLLHPRIEERIRQASEDDLRIELKYLHELIGSIIQQPTPRRTQKLNSKSKQTHRKKMSS